MIFINILRTGTSILTCLIFLLLIPLRGGSIMPARKTPPDWKQIFSTQREMFCVSVSSSSFKIWSDHPFNVVSISLLQNCTHFQGTYMPDFLNYLEWTSLLTQISRRSALLFHSIILYSLFVPYGTVPPHFNSNNLWFPFYFRSSWLWDGYEGLCRYTYCEKHRGNSNKPDSFL